MSWRLLWQSICIIDVVRMLLSLSLFVDGFCMCSGKRTSVALEKGLGLLVAKLCPLRVVGLPSAALCSSPTNSCRFCVVQVCVSAVDPELFPACVAAGAEMVELGNFDCFYDQVNRRFRFCSVWLCFSS